MIRKILCSLAAFPRIFFLYIDIIHSMHIHIMWCIIFILFGFYWLHSVCELESFEVEFHMPHINHYQVNSPENTWDFKFAHVIGNIKRVGNWFLDKVTYIKCFLCRDFDFVFFSNTHSINIVFLKKYFCNISVLVFVIITYIYSIHIYIYIIIINQIFVGEDLQMKLRNLYSEDGENIFL